MIQGIQPHQRGVFDTTVRSLGLDPKGFEFEAQQSQSGLLVTVRRVATGAERDYLASDDRWFSELLAEVFAGCFDVPELLH